MILMEVLEQYNKSFCSDGNVAYYGSFNLNWNLKIGGYPSGWNKKVDIYAKEPLWFFGFLL